MKGLNRSEFVEIFSKRNGISRAMGREIVVGVFALLSDMFDNMDCGEKIVIKGFGTFTKKDYPAHTATKFGKEGVFEIPQRTRITFKRSRSTAYSTNGEYDDMDDED